MKKQESPQPAGKPGPRTSQGKARSSVNAITHGLFAKVILVEEYDLARGLLKGFQQTFQPRDAIERAEVHSLVMHYLRLQRIDRFEASVIANARVRAMLQSADRIDRRQLESFLPLSAVAQAENPETVDPVRPSPCLTLLEELARSLNKSLDKPEWDPAAVLRVIELAYGRRKSALAGLIIHLCNVAQGKRIASEEAQKAGQLGAKHFEGLVELANHKFFVLGVLHSEMARLKALDALEETIDAQAFGNNAISLPPDLVHERLLKCRAAAERSIDRGLDRLQKLREMRVGAKRSNDRG